MFDNFRQILIICYKSIDFVRFREMFTIMKFTSQFPSAFFVIYNHKILKIIYPTNLKIIYD